MIVRFLSKSASFKGVSYNTRKVDKDKGELMKVSGFGPLQGMNGLRPKDYINYLKMISAQNKRVKLPQLHVAISAKGRSHGKGELTEIAVNWLKEMGYTEQPYLIIFHKDTANNHVHVVSSRVDKSGKKISSAFERVRGMTAIQKVLGMDEKQAARNDLDLALSYRFSTKPQFMLLLESKGYTLQQEKGMFKLIKFGKNLIELPVSQMEDRAADYVHDGKRAAQLTAIFQRYRFIHNTTAIAVTEVMPGGLEKAKPGYRSDFADFMKRDFGVELVFHGAVGKPPYGYTVLNHDQQIAFKGKEIMDIQVLLEPVALQLTDPELVDIRDQGTVQVQDLGSFSEMQSRLTDLTDTLVGPDISDELSVPYYPQLDQSSFGNTFQPADSAIDISISDDIDDQAIHGRNRHRKRQARTNTR